MERAVLDSGGGKKKVKKVGGDNAIGGAIGFLGPTKNSECYWRRRGESTAVRK
jgi:hypothetical protein